MNRHERYSTPPQSARDSGKATHPDYRGGFKRTRHVTRRGFLTRSGIAAVTAGAGTLIRVVDRLPGAASHAASAQSDELADLERKDDLIVLNERPLNLETPAHLLDDEVTPAARLFVRNNGIPPSLKGLTADDWVLEVAGESCARPGRFTLGRLKTEFDHYSYQLVLECAGNGRSEFNPPALGNQWSVGAVGCPRWTGVRLRDVLMQCGVKENAVYVGYYGADLHISGDSSRVPISRGIPIGKALDDETLLAWAMNGREIPVLHGFPLRLVVGGWPASVSGKWLKKLAIRDRVHDGPKMGGQSYRVPCKPVAPGTKVPDEDMCIIESMPVKSILTAPKSGLVHPANQPLAVRGKAWAGDLEVERVFVSIDYGATWKQAKLSPPVNRLAWQSFAAELTFPSIGYFEVWARAIDSLGRAQPMVLPGWNPRGYLNNACHRIAVQAV